MSSKHLYVEQADVPHAAAWRASTTWSDGSPLWDERYVKNSPTGCALLNVGFMVVLRRAGWYVLIWARRVVPTNLQLSSFQTSQLLEQNLKHYFSVLVLCRCCSRNDAVELYGRSHPAHNAARMVYHIDHRPCGCQGIQVLIGRSKGHGLNGFDVKGF